MSRLRKKSENSPENAPSVRGPGPATSAPAGADAAPDAATADEGVDGDGSSTGKRFPRGRVGWDELWRNIKRGKYG